MISQYSEACLLIIDVIEDSAVQLASKLLTTAITTHATMPSRSSSIANTETGDTYTVHMLNLRQSKVEGYLPSNEENCNPNAKTKSSCRFYFF